MSSRRIFLKSIVPFAAVVALPKTSEARQVMDEDICQFHADGLAEAMKARHGGEWVIALNPHGGSIFGRRISP